MTEGVAILVPVLARPGNVKPLLESIRASTPDPCRVLFICDPGDRPQQDAIAMEGGWMLSPGGTYSAKIRLGVEATDERFLFLGADDLTFMPGWLEAARAAMTGGVQVVGVNDCRPRNWETATHFLVTREYALLPTIDGGPGPLHPYMHNFTDRELIETAKHRGVYAYAPRSRVEHRHHLDGRAPHDATYAKGQATFRRDQRLFMRRARLWTTAPSS